MANAWDTASARARQQALARSVELADRLGRVESVAGVDVAFREAGAVAQAAVALLAYPSLSVLECLAVRVPVDWPYVPGLLAWREYEPIRQALARLANVPDVILCDGHGIAHPRRCGIACHLGVGLDRCAIGVAKSRYVGTHGAPGAERGASATLWHRGEPVGRVVRTRTRVRPVYVSPGHRVSLDTAQCLALACAPRYRLPEPLRLADRASRADGAVVTDP